MYHRVGWKGGVRQPSRRVGRKGLIIQIIQIIEIITIIMIVKLMILVTILYY